jgi:hypothetical protein
MIVVPLVATSREPPPIQSWPRSIINVQGPSVSEELPGDFEPAAEDVDAQSGDRLRLALAAADFVVIRVISEDLVRFC